MEEYDFSGYATKNDLKCADGRVIRRDAFKDNDGTAVPLVWQHVHDNPMNVIGHAVLENRADGVYAYCKLNGTEPAKHAKTLVKHGDVNAMSIFANRLVQKGSDVIHGVIREISLVLAGANPGAYIEQDSITHSDGSVAYLDGESEAVIHCDTLINTMPNFKSIQEDRNSMVVEPIIQHADEKNQNGSKEEESSDETIQDVFNSMTEEQKNVVYYLVAQAAGEADDEDEDEMQHADDSNDGPTIEDIFNSMTEKQKNVAYYLIGQAAEDNDEEDIEEITEESETTMKHNVFEGFDDENVISHDDMMAAIEDTKRYGSMKDSFIAHGIEQIDILFPEAKSVSPTPDMITRPMGWVSEVWNGLKKSPFSRIKSVAANLTKDEARAKGYIKGKKKIEEQFGLLKRITTPQTVYKKQALDRDDIIDITDFDVVAWLKAEMRMMLDEELARAVLVGDGRSIGDEDKINEQNIRPIYQDDDLYTIHYTVDTSKATDDNEISQILVDSAVRARKEYRGSGNPAFYASTDVINDMLLARDKIGHRLYGNETELAAALRVSKIVEVPILEGIIRTDEEKNKHELLGLIVNLNDYTVGTDRGGEVNFFDDFDIDYNKEKYLLETRFTGTLTKPYSAIALERTPSTTSGGTTSGGTTGGDTETQQVFG